VRPPPTDAAPASTSPTLLALFLVVVSLGAACGSAAPPTGSDRFHRGVCWVAGRAVDAGDLEPLVRLHASWISQTPFGWQAEPEDTEIETATSGHVLWGESDEGLIETTRLAHARGIRVLLKPHLWLRRGWPGDIAMRREEDWRAWFASYREFILHYADLAQRAGIEALAVGTELGGTTRREAEWRALIADVRARYRGKLTYCANWSEDVEHVAFWDALDWIAPGDEFVEETFEKLIPRGDVGVFVHDGFFGPMDTIKDRQRLEGLHESGRAPWRLVGDVHDARPA